LALQSQLQAQATQSTQSQPQATQSQPQATQSQPQPEATQSQPATGRPGVIAAGPQSTTQAQSRTGRSEKWKHVMPTDATTQEREIAQWQIVNQWKRFFLKARQIAHLKGLCWGYICMYVLGSFLERLCIRRVCKQLKSS